MKICTHTHTHTHTHLYIYAYVYMYITYMHTYRFERCPRCMHNRRAQLAFCLEGESAFNRALNGAITAS